MAKDDHCDALFGHAWVQAAYTDPKRAAKGWIRQTCANTAANGKHLCMVTREAKVAAGSRKVLGKDGWSTEPVREINSWAGGRLEKGRPVQKAGKKSGGEVTSHAGSTGCLLVVLYTTMTMIISLVVVVMM